MGRALKFGEPTIKREFRIPESLNERLTVEARQRDANLSDVLVAALRRELDGPRAPEPKLESTPALVDTIREAVKEARAGASLDLTAEELAELGTLASAIGYRRAADFASDLARRALDLPLEQVREFLMADLDAEVEARVQARLAREDMRATATKPAPVPTGTPQEAPPKRKRKAA